MLFKNSCFLIHKPYVLCIYYSVEMLPRAIFSRKTAGREPYIKIDSLTKERSRCKFSRLKALDSLITGIHALSLCLLESAGDVLKDRTPNIDNKLEVTIRQKCAHSVFLSETARSFLHLSLFFELHYIITEI